MTLERSCYSQREQLVWKQNRWKSNDTGYGSEDTSKLETNKFESKQKLAGSLVVGKKSGLVGKKKKKHVQRHRFPDETHKMTQ